MGSSNNWNRAVRVNTRGTELYSTLGVAGRHGDEGSQPDAVQFVLRVLDPNQSRTPQAWSATFTADDISRMIADEQSMDLAAPLINTAVAACIGTGNLRPCWEGSSLYFECWFDTFNQAAIPAAQAADLELLPRAVKLKLPPNGSMKAESGAAFNSINAGVLSSLMQQNAQMQQHIQLLDLKVAQLQKHAQAVHDSYAYLVSKVERGELLSESAGLAGLAGLKTSAVGHRPQTGHDITAATQAEVTASQQMPLAGSQRYPCSPGVDAVGAGSTQTFDLNSSPGLRLAGPSQLEPAGVSGSAAAGASGVSYTRRQRQQQQTRQEALRQRLLTDHKQLQQEWQDQMQMILRADNLADAQHLSAGAASAGQQQAKLQRAGYNRQNSDKRSGDVGSGKLDAQVGSQQDMNHKPPIGDVAAPAQAAVASDGFVPAAITDLSADEGDAEPGLTVATTRHVVRRAHTAKPLLIGKRRR